MFGKDSRKTLIAKIHIGKQKLAMDEISYRTMLQRLTGKQSCKQMTIVELMKVQTEMENKGFKITKRRYSASSKKAIVNSKIALKIRAVWIDMAKNGMVRDGSEQALNAWVRGVVNGIYAKQQHNVLVLNISALDDKMAAIVLERLKKWQARGAK